MRRRLGTRKAQMARATVKERWKKTQRLKSAWQPRVARAPQAPPTSFRGQSCVDVDVDDVAHRAGCGCGCGSELMGLPMG